MSSQPDYYAILQVHPQASLAVIKRAYKTLLMELGHHPDRGGDPAQAALITEAYRVLSDTARREAYDRARRLAAESPVSSGALVMLCPACATKNRVRSEAVLAIAKCSRCGQRLSHLPQSAVAPRPVPRRRLLAVAALSLAIALSGTLWALNDWQDGVAVPGLVGQGGLMASARWIFDRGWLWQDQNPRLLEKLGETYLLEQRFADAADHFRRAADILPENAHLRARQGRALMLMGDLTGAELAYKRALHLKPDYAPAVAELGHLHLQRRRYEEAVQYFERSLRLEPRADIAHHLGLVFKVTAKEAPAMAAFQQAVRLDPSYRASHMQLGELHNARGEYARALEHYVAASQLRHEDLELHLKLAQLYEHTGQRRHAIREWNLCLAQGNGNPSIEARARRALESLGR
jgi:tetratricopeptide (TPR) repeat protein